MATVGEAVREHREDIPLKSGSKVSKLWSCDEESFGGSKFINISFAVLSTIITVALLVQIYYGDYQVTPHGSVATDSRECSAIGTSILKKGGNSVDAAIASALCLAVVNPHVTGLDASGQMMIYNHKTRLNPVVIEFNKIKDSDALPCLIDGLFYIHKKFGKLLWNILVEPSVSLAQNGFLISHNFDLSAEKFKVAQLYSNMFEAGEKLHLYAMSSYLKKIGNISEEDLYEFISNSHIQTESVATMSKFKNYNVYLPGNSDATFALLYNFQQMNIINTTAGAILPFHILQLVEITKNTYEEFNYTNRFYKGTTSNVAVMDLNDNYVSLVTGLTSPFGKRNMTDKGYFIDNVPKKSPFRIPIIITDSNYVCGKRIIFGTGDIAIASQIILTLLLTNGNATTSVEAPRFNVLGNNLLGIEVAHRPTFSKDVMAELKLLVPYQIEYMKEPYSSCNIVEKLGDSLNSHSDSRGGGIASRF